MVGNSSPGWTAITAPLGDSSSRRPTVQWTAATGATEYEVWIDDLTTGQRAVVLQRNVSGTSLQVPEPLSVGHDYRVWVRSHNAYGYGDWSRRVDFTISASVQSGALSSVIDDLFGRQSHLQMLDKIDFVP